MTHGSLFHGFGGIARGFERVGINTIWTVDLINGQDIRTEEPNRYADVDILSGGPPCIRGSAAASFSRSRTKQTLWPEMLRFVGAKRPQWVLVENVKGFKREMVEWTLDLQRMGYGCSGRAIDSRHWVPQQRTRYFIVGRLGISGLALRDLLYADRERVERRKQPEELRQRITRDAFDGSCADCLRGGIFARAGARKFALMGAGNAVTQPIAEWIGRRIVEAIGRTPLAPQQETR